MNVSRQTVHPAIHELEEEGLLGLMENIRHRKAPLVRLTASGHARLEHLLRMEERWIASVARGFDERTLAQAEWVIRLIRQRLCGLTAPLLSPSTAPHRDIHLPQPFSQS